MKMKLNKKEKRNHLISVIVPIYNCEKYLTTCVESIINQTYKNIEIILVNDGSKDNSLKMCYELSKRDERIKVYTKENGGAGSARNLGIQKSLGKYIQFVDADDFIDNNMTELLVNNIADYDTVICGYKYIKNGTEVGKQFTDEQVIDIENNEQGFVELLDKYMFTPINKLYLKSKKPEFREDYKFGEDFVFNLDYLYNCNCVKIIPATPYHYNIDTPGSLTKANRNKYIELFKNIYIELIKFNKEKLKNKFGTEYIYNYFFEQLTTNFMYSIFTDKKNAYHFIKTTINDPIVNTWINNIKGKNKTLAYKFKIFLLKKHMIRLFITLINLRKRFYMKDKITW